MFKPFRLLKNKLRDELLRSSKIISIKKSEGFDFGSNDLAYTILEGEILSHGERNLTQILKKDDPIGFAQAIVNKRELLTYRRLTGVTLLCVSGKEVRESANSSSMVVQSIVKFCLGRILNEGKTRGHHIFEENFIRKNWDKVRTFNFNEGDKVFLKGQPAKSLYYIESGSVNLIGENGRILAKVNGGESFGEAAILRQRFRKNSAIANERTILYLIDGEYLIEEVNKDQILAKFVLLNLIKQVELMNQLRKADDFLI